MFSLNVVGERTTIACPFDPWPIKVLIVPSKVKPPMSQANNFSILYRVGVNINRDHPRTNFFLFQHCPIVLAEVICWKHHLPPPTSPKSATYESLHLSWLWEGFFYKHFANFLQGEQKFQIFNVLRLLKCISWLLGRDAADVFPLIIRKYGVLFFYLHSVYKLLF